MNTIGEKINVQEITKISRQFNITDLLSLLKSDIMKFWSWGSHSFTIDSNKDCRMFRMTVNGNHHKGHVYIFLNFLDLFDVYLTTSHGTIKTIIKDQYFDMLIDSIDNNIERIPEYTD